MLLIMKLTAIILLAACLQVSARGFGQKVTLNAKGAPMKKIFREIHRQTGYQFFFEDELLTGMGKMDLTVKDVPLQEVLDKCFRNLALNYTVIDKTIYIKADANKHPLEVTVAPVVTELKGRVTDSEGKPLSGASVRIKGTDIGTSTDEAGYFVLATTERGITLVISYVGFDATEIKVSGEENIQVTLRIKETKTEEIVVIGYGTQRKADLTGAVGTVNISKTMPARPVTNVQELLASAVPGLNVAKSSGAPGSGASLNIRGVSTIGGSSGVLVIIDGFPGNIYTLNPNDIESVSVLKDAASASIYGSRAANGVVLITTKRGRKGAKTEVEVNSNISLQQPQFQIDFVGSADYMKLWDQTLVNDGKPPLYGEQGLADLAAGKYSDNDWYREIYKKRSLLTNQSVAVSGSSEKVIYRIAGSYDYQDGTLPNNDYTKFIVRPDLSIKISEKLTLDANLQYTQTFIDQPQGGTESWQVAAARAAPISAIRTKSGQFGVGSSFVNNPVAGVNEGGYNQSRYTELFTVIGLTYSPLKNWNIKGNFSRNSLDQRTSDRVLSYFLYDEEGNIAKKQNLVTNLTESYSSSWRNTLQLTTDYLVSKGDHNIKLLAGYSQEYYKTDNFSGFRDNLPFNDVNVLNTGSAANQRSTGSATDVAIQSVFGRLNYDYAGKYLFQVNVRADGSSRFAEGHRWGVFPSFSAGWNVHKEAFFHVPAISQLKVRGSWGILGDAEKVSAYATAQVLAYNPQIYGFNGAIVPGAYNNVAIDPNITWERAKQSNIGIDLGLFRQKISISADYFYNQRENILTAPLVPDEFGLAGPVRNLFAMDNSGFEFLVAYRDSRKDFNWGIDFNVGYSKNKVKYIGDGVDYIISGNTYTKVGGQLNLPYGLQATGLFKDAADVASQNQGANVFPGNIKFADINKSGIIDGDDRMVLNDKVPVRYGSNINFGWKNFDLSANVYGSLNNYRYISGYEGWAFYLSQNARPWALDSWTPDNPDASYPRLSTQYTSNDTRYSSYWLKKASYLKIQNVQVGYSIPAVVLAKAKINYLRVYVSAQNLATISGYPGFDPEGGYYPLSRTYAFGVNLKF
ncbi:putative TonB-dependent receptor [Flavihumibacter petaseus NBRC 106054]|uniref:Putative TonB-dependent receptor n=2 Tax=Flavihumibacter TaxID=1004301 RepID=A0A0E9MY38_9BACT|nr:putative TonB-dependent receptor [Flavihumibacter petaseus NBRC 106054]